MTFCIKCVRKRAREVEISALYIYCRPFRITKTTLIVWLKQAKINIWNRALKATFYFKKSFLTRNIAKPPGKYLWRELFTSPWAFAFFLTPLPTFSKCGTESCLPQQKEAGLILRCHY